MKCFYYNDLEKGHEGEFLLLLDRITQHVKDHDKEEQHAVSR